MRQCGLLTTSIATYIIILMSPFIKLFLASLIAVFAYSPAFAQSPIPTPKPGFNQSDFAKDVTEGVQSIKNDNDGQNNQKEVNDNEVDEGQQENENVHADEQIDQDEAQKNQEGEQKEAGQSETNEGTENGKNTTVRNEGRNGNNVNNSTNQ